MSKAINRAGALAKHWAYHKHTTGLVQRSLSPFEQEVVKPMFHNLGPKLMKKVTDNAWDVLPPIVLGVLLVKWANADYHRRTKEHWS